MADTGVSDTIHCVPISVPSVHLSGIQTLGPLVSKCMYTCTAESEEKMVEADSQRPKQARQASLASQVFNLDQAFLSPKSCKSRNGNC